MRIPMIAAALVLVPTVAFGQDVSPTKNWGWHSGWQSPSPGPNVSRTIQDGRNNHAGTRQSNGYNSSIIVQHGDGFSQTSEQTGGEAFGSLQAMSKHYSGSRTGSTGKITVHWEIRAEND